MDKQSMPTWSTKSNKRIDLYFENLDIDSRKKVIADLKKGYAIKIPVGKSHNEIKSFKLKDISDEDLSYLNFWETGKAKPLHVLYNYDEKKHEYVTLAKSEIKSKMILDPSSFGSYIQSLHLEPIEKVKDRYNKIKSVEDGELTEYINSGLQAKDIVRLELELGKIENKNKPGEYVINKDPSLIRKSYNPDNVINFYEHMLSSSSKYASLDMFSNRLIASSILRDISIRISDNKHYAGLLDEIDYKLGMEPRSKVSNRIYDLCNKLPKDRCAAQIKNLKRLAASIQMSYNKRDN